MEKFIDIGIDFGAENIVVVAIGYDNKDRKDYKLVYLAPSGSLKNYLGEKKADNRTEIGLEAKTAFIYNDMNQEYNWLAGRYKAFIGEKSPAGFPKPPEELLEKGLNEVINRIEQFDFSPILSGKLRNLTVGVPQSWDFNKKQLYREVLSGWNHGNVTLLSEPVAATIAAYKRSSAEIGGNIIMILDIGASTFDISFARYTEERKNLEIFRTNFRSSLAGHYFDLIFASFVLSADINKLPAGELIDIKNKLKLRKTEDYLDYLKQNQSRFFTLLLELENIKENQLLEITKFNRKKLIDIGTRTLVTITRQIYNDALSFYATRLAAEIRQVLAEFKKNEAFGEDSRIIPFLCGGASSLAGLEKILRDKIGTEESNNIFSLVRESQGSKIDMTIAIGLAYYAQDKSIISKSLEYSLGVKFLTGEEPVKKDYWLLKSGEKFPLERDKAFSELLDDESDLEYHGSGDGKIGFPLIRIKEGGEEYPVLDTVELEMEHCEPGDRFDLLFNLDFDGVITIGVKNLTKGTVIRKTIH